MPLPLLAHPAPLTAAARYLAVASPGFSALTSPPEGRSPASRSCLTSGCLPPRSPLNTPRGHVEAYLPGGAPSPAQQKLPPAAASFPEGCHAHAFTGTASSHCGPLVSIHSLLEGELTFLSSLRTYILSLREYLFTQMMSKFLRLASPLFRLGPSRHRAALDGGSEPQNNCGPFLQILLYKILLTELGNRSASAQHRHCCMSPNTVR